MCSLAEMHNQLFMMLVVNAAWLTAKDVNSGCHGIKGNLIIIEFAWLIKLYLCKSQKLYRVID